MLYPILLLVCLAGTRPPCQPHEEIAHGLASARNAGVEQTHVLVGQQLDTHPGDRMERLRRGREA